MVEQALDATFGAVRTRSGTADYRSRLRRRTLLVTGGLAVVGLGLFVLTMMVGSYGLGPWEVLASALHLTSDPATDFVVRELRLPTALTALAVGIAFGVAGILFQTLLANPLASPDFVGVSSGAGLFAVAAIVFVNAGTAGISLAALAGALVSAALVYLLAWRDGISGYRFILIGIGVSQFLTVDRRLRDRQGGHLRRPRGDELARRLGRPGRLVPAPRSCSRPWRSCCRRRCCSDARCGRSSSATTPPARSAPVSSSHASR